MELDLVFKIAIVGLIAAVVNQILTRTGRDDYGLLATLAGIVVVLLMLLPKLVALYDELRAFNF